ncbi:hypothetical protein KUTeg_023537 [Tegillarca granosa]|uniref:Transporter n=1 Tax=Tegillarca granosa TaxID=220873 RepID=A0ABQ9E6I2_TEGGR|nr:hypothetical protein KUTeg_023537 [Tegillarca granosa]
MKDNILTDPAAVITPQTEKIPESGEEVNYIFKDGLEVVNIRPVDDQDNVSQKSSDSGTDQSSEESRATWGGQLEFILTCVGYAVGLGNVWRFPYLCYKNGGGAFLIPYTLMLALVGLPLFFMELAFGQYAGLGPISIWRINPLFKGLGYAMVIVSWLIGLYYNVIISHVLYYLVRSFTSVLPWTTCNNTWNTNDCLPYEKPDIGNGSLVIHTSNHSLTPSEEFYRNHVLDQTESIDNFGTVEWQLAVTLLVAWFIVWIVLLKGIQSLGKVVYFTAIFPYVMLTVLFFRGVTLPGAGNGIIYYLKPDFARLGDPRVWSDACTQIFYSLSACSGGLIAMSSYNKFKNNCYRDALIVCIINCGTSIFAGLVIFSILGYMAYEKGRHSRQSRSKCHTKLERFTEVKTHQIPKSGLCPGLAFIVYPEALARMPISPMWSVFFFIMMATLGFGSEFSIVECVLSALCDEFKILNKRRAAIIFRTVMVIICFLLGLPMVCRVTGVLNMIMYKEPDLDGVYYPEWAKALGWLIVLFPVLTIPGWFMFKYCTEGGFALMKERMQPLPSWGPSLGKHTLPEINVRYTEDDKQGYNPAFARLMGSNVSTSTCSTDITALNLSTMALTKSTDKSSNRK